MKHLTGDDLHFVVTRLPKDVVNLLKNERLFIGGGFIRACVAGETVNDIDLFGKSKDDLARIANSFSITNDARKMYTTANAITILELARTPIQFITRWVYEDPAKVAESFDFTVCQSVVWFECGTWRSLVSNEFYQDLASKRLRYTSPLRNEDAGGSILRVVKFLRRGYNIAPESLAAVIARFIQGACDHGGNLWADEEGKAKILGGLMREVDPLTVIDGVEFRGADEDEDPIPLEGAAPVVTTPAEAVSENPFA
jgi:hypothetical protein